ncbi:gas vesicle protein [Streptomyces sp. NPDC057020]|nr:hypothetical protein AMK27_06535 [Streptomyces sp. CB02009]
MPYGPSSSANLADILERVLDKGIVIAGDIRINLLDIELLTIKLRILVASVDKAKEMGIDWWEHDPSLSSKAGGGTLEEENRRLRAEVEALKRGAAISDDARHPESLRRRERVVPEIDELGTDEPEDQDVDPDAEDEPAPRRGAARRKRST